MKGAYIDKPKKGQKLQIKQLPPPQPGGDEILIENYASSVNPIDWKICEGELKLISRFTFSGVPGSDFAGIVIKSNDRKFSEGDEVFGMTNYLKGGAFAENIVVKRENVWYKPSTINFIAAGILPLTGLTALQGLINYGKIRKGMDVLVNGCTGGVGYMAAQIVKSFQAHVTGVCSTRGIKLANNIGVDEIVDYKKESIPNRKYDIIFDTVGNLHFNKMKKLLTDRGTFITTHFSTENLFYSFLPSGKLKIISVKPRANDLKQLADLIETGQLQPVIDKSFFLREINDAFEYSKKGRTKGKISLKMK